MQLKKVLLFFSILVIGLSPQVVEAMHIMEGFLPIHWAIGWFLVTIPFLIYGMKNIKEILVKNPNKKVLLGLAAAFVFVLSALKIPSITGSCSHPTGTGLGTILFGPGVMSVIGSIVLLFQAILLAHGGLTTLGANIFSMAIAGPMVVFTVYTLGKKSKINRKWVIFMAASLGNLGTYVVTAFQLALAHPDVTSGFIGALSKFLTIFALTQIPLAIAEGILTVIVFNLLEEYKKEGGEIIEDIL